MNKMSLVSLPVVVLYEAVWLAERSYVLIGACC